MTRIASLLAFGKVTCSNLVDCKARPSGCHRYQEHPYQCPFCKLYLDSFGCSEAFSYDRPGADQPSNYASPSPSSTAAEGGSIWGGVAAAANKSPEGSAGGTPPRQSRRPQGPDLKVWV